MADHLDVILVDDDPMMLDQLAALVSETTSLRVKSFQDPEEALMCVRNEAPAFAIIDLVMPDMSEDEVRSIMRQFLEFKTHVYVYTGGAIDDIKRASLKKQGFARIIEEEMSPQSLHKILEEENFLHAEKMAA